MLNSKNFELSKTAIKKVLRIVEHDSIISQSKNNAKILFVSGKANTETEFLFTPTPIIVENFYTGFCLKLVSGVKIAREANLTLFAKKVLEPEPKNPKEKPQTH